MAALFRFLKLPSLMDLYSRGPVMLPIEVLLLREQFVFKIMLFFKFCKDAYCILWHVFKNDIYAKIYIIDQFHHYPH